MHIVSPVLDLLKGEGSQGETTQHLHQTSSSNVAPGIDNCVHELIQAQSRSNPDGPAICAWDGDWSHQHLDSIASSLAQRLIVDHGLCPGDTVLLAFERSAWVVIAMLAVIKAGAAVAPLDLKLPKPRLEQMVASLSASLVLAFPETPLAYELGVRVVPIQREDSTFTQPEHPISLPSINSSSTLYLVPAHGNAERLDTAAISHWTFISETQYHASPSQLNSQTRCLHAADYTSQLYLHEILTPLVGGGCVCIPSESDSTNRLMAVMEEMKVNWASVTPTLLPLEPERLPSLKTLVLFDDTCDQVLIDRWSSHVRVVQGHDWTRENTLRNLWATSLGIPMKDIGRDDSFFRLGGDSITALTLSGIARSKGLVLSVPDIMQNQTLSTMATFVKNEPVKAKGENVDPFSLIPEKHRISTRREAALGCRVREDSISDIYPCTSLQEGLLALSGKTASSGANIIRDIFNVDPNADMTRLTAAWATVFHLNPELRTRLLDTPSVGLVQVVVDHNLDFASRDSIEACDSPEDTDFTPGSSFVRLRMISNPSLMQRCFVLIAHHSVLDGWQLRLILQQVEQVYGGHVITGMSRFKNFVRHITQLDREKEALYWRRMLDDSSVASFPSFPSNSESRWSNCHMKRDISFADHDIKNKAMDFTLSTYIRQAWALICAAYTGSNDVIFGVSVNGRNALVPGIEQVCGPTIASIPLRVNLNYGASVHDSLQALHNQGINMMPYEQTGLQNIRKMGMAPATACNYQSFLVIQPPRADTDDYVMTQCEGSREAFLAQSNNPLVVECALLQGRAGARVQVAYNDQVFKESDVDRILKQLDHVLSQLLSSSKENSPLGDIDVITPGEIDQLHYWNGCLAPAMDYCVHDLIQGRLATMADSQAVYASDRSLTARELDDLSSRLAIHLRSLEIGPGVTVPVFIERSSLTIITMLAVLKSGNTCVTLDKRQPPSRLALILQRTSAQFMLVSKGHQGLLSTPDVTQIIVTHEALSDMPSPVGRIVTGITPDSAAFVMFTSGSTGEPKGIVHSHRSMCSIIVAHGVGVNIKQGSRVLQFASPSFDTSIWEILMTLVLGGCICVPFDDERMNDPGAFANRAQVDLTLSSPTAIRSMSPDDVPSLKTVILVGEALPRDVVEAWSRSATVLNGYGPAECGGCSTHAIDETRWPLATLGQTRGCVFWLTDPANTSRLAPIGAIGEILIEGPIIAHGYLNDPEKTEASFLTDVPWLKSLRPGENRLYRSGDLGMYNSDGTVVYLGRRDGQVKLRGQRVELGEVEHHLRRLVPATNLAADVIRFGETDYLVAFFAESDNVDVPLALLPHSQRVNQSAQISSELAKVLPPYMVPSVYLPVSCIPTTSSSKTDRKVLRAMATSLSKEEIAGYHSTESMEELSTIQELELSEVWADLLEISPKSIGGKSHFFHVGGNSVEAMKLVSMARRQGRDLNFSRVYQSPLLCDMAKHWSLIGGWDAEFEKEWPPFSLLDNSDNEVFLALNVCEPFAIPRDDIIDAYPAHDNQYFTFKSEECLYARFDIPESLDLARVIDAWMMVVRQHDILRTVLVPHKAAFLAVVLGSLGWEIEEHTATDESEVDTIVQNESNIGPQFATALGKILVIRNAEKRATTLVLKISHCIYDGYCLAIYWKDWQSAYETSRVPSRLQYQDVLSSWKFFEGREKSLRYWETLLRDAEIFDLPATCMDFAPDGKPRFVERKLDGVVAPSGMVLDSLIKAAWAMTMAAMTGRSDVVFVQISSGRWLGGQKIENATGPLMGIFPVRVLLNPISTATELMQTLQDQDTNGIEHEMIDPDELWDIRGWQNDTPFTLIDHVKSDIESQLILDGVQCGPHIGTPIKTEPLTMCVVKTWERQAHISISPHPTIALSTVEEAIDLFCAKLQAFSQDPSTSIY